MKHSVILLAALLPLAVNAESLNLNLRDGSTRPVGKTADYVREINYDDSGVDVSFHFEEATLVKDRHYPNAYHWSICGFEENDVEGEPAYISHMEKFVVPAGMDAVLTISHMEQMDYNVEMAPAYRAVSMSDTTVYIPEKINSTGIFPAKNVEIAATGIYRGRDVLYVKVSPVRYDSSTGTVHAVTELKYRIDFVPKASAQSVDDAERRVLPVDDVFYNVVLNADKEDDEDSLISPQYVELDRKYRAPDYLIISDRTCKSAADSLAQWKRTCGFNTTIAVKSEWTESSILETVKSYYRSLPNLQYLLLLGDKDNLPGKILSTDNSGIAGDTTKYYSDYYYGCMDGDKDLEQDIYVGRITSPDLHTAMLQINKIISHEKNPPAEKSFYDNVILVSQFDDNGLWNKYTNVTDPSDGMENLYCTYTSENIATYMEGIGKTPKRLYKYTGTASPERWNFYAYDPDNLENYIPDNLSPSIFNWNTESQDITSALEAGSFLTIYNGHGGVDCWIQGNFYNPTEINNNLHNGNLLPVILSMACLTGTYKTYGHTGTSPCLAECFMRRDGGGACGMVAAYYKSLSGDDDQFVVGMVNSIWPQPGFSLSFHNWSSGNNDSAITPVHRIGQIMRSGLDYLTKKSSYIAVGSPCQYTKEIYHYFGDPAMMLYTKVPASPVFRMIANSPTVGSSGNTYALQSSVAGEFVIEANNIIYRNPENRVNINSNEKILSWINDNYPVITKFNSNPFGASGNTPYITNVRKEGENIIAEYTLVDSSDEMASLELSDIYGNTISITTLDGSGAATLSVETSLSTFGILYLMRDGIVLDSRKITF